MTGLRVGLVARADDRGLGHMTWELARALTPEKVLVVDLGDGSRFPNRFDRYDRPLVARWDKHTGRFADPSSVRAWLDGLDVLYTAETFYDWRLVGWARDASVATVLHVMPELLPDPLPAQPDAMWAPTLWRLGDLPAGVSVVPVPVATDRPHRRGSMPADGPLRVLHVAGRRAAADRNGTLTFIRALRDVTAPMEVTITAQEQRMPSVRHPRSVSVRTLLEGQVPSDYWRLYDGHDVLVMPRRYGGLCLPVQEAAAAGLAVVMTDVDPNGDYPASLVPVRPAGTIESPAGHIGMVEADPRALAATLDALASHRPLLTAAKERAAEWAESRSWDRWAETYRTALMNVVADTGGRPGAG